MKQSLRLLALIAVWGLGHCAYGQGWHAEIHLEVGDEIPIVENANVSLSGFTVFDYSRSVMDLVIDGQGPLPTSMAIYVSGLSDEGFGATAELRAQYDLGHLTPCAADNFNIVTESGHVTGSIVVYPQLQINSSASDCGQVSLSTTTCGGVYYWTWEVGEHALGPFKTLPVKSASISITAQDLATVGFTGYGRKFFRVTSAPGTTSSIEVVDIPYPAPTASFTLTSPKCHGGNNGAISVKITSALPEEIDDFVVTISGNGIAKQEVLTNTSTALIPGLIAGSYQVTIENNSDIILYGSCSRSYQIGPLIDPEEIKLQASSLSNHNGFNIACHGGSDGFIEVRASGGTGVYRTYAWTPDVSATRRASDLVSGTYSVKVTDSNYCESKPINILLTEPEMLQLQLASAGGKGGFDVSCYDQADGVLTTSVSGGVPAYRYLWGNGSMESQLGGLATGTYTLSVSDANGCTTDGSYSLVAPDPIEFDIEQVSGIQCAGEQTGALTVLSPQNTIGSVYYHWSSGETSKDITAKAAGTYSLTVSDDQGCHAVRSYTLEEPAAWSVDLVPTSSYNGAAIRCNGESNGTLATIVTDDNGNVTTAQYYDWYKDGKAWLSGAGVSSIGDLNAGTYSVKITYNTFCQSERAIMLKEPDALVADVLIGSNYNGFPISCYDATDGILRAGASGGTGSAYTYTWHDGRAGGTLTNLGAGTYVVTVRDANGCESRAEKTLTRPPPVSPAITTMSDYNGQAISCSGAADARLRATASGGASGFHYVWSTGGTGRDLVDLSAGSYSATVTDANGCAATASITIMNPTPVTAAITTISDYGGFGVSCHGAADGYLSSTAAGGTGVYQYTWSHNSMREAGITGLMAGHYEVRITDQNGCSATADAALTEPEVLAVALTDIQNPSCFGSDDGTVTLVASGGVEPFMYAKENSQWQQAPLFSNLSAGATAISISDRNGCTYHSMAILTAPEPLVIHFDDMDPAFCGDPRGRIAASVSGGTGAYAYQWTDAHENTISRQASIAEQPAGIYYLTVTDSHSCTATESAGITSTDGPKVNVTATEDATCFTSADGSAHLEVIEGDGPFTFRWQDGQTESAALHLSRGDYFVEITDGHHCTTVKTVSIGAPTALDVRLVDDYMPTCHGNCDGKLRLGATGGNGNYRYLWESGVAGPTRSSLCAGTYAVTVADEKGCSVRKTFVLAEPQPLVVKRLVADLPACHDGCDGRLALSATGGTGALRYTWSTGAIDPTISGLCPGTYTAVVSDVHGCSITASYLLENPPRDLLDLGGSATLCTGQTYLLDPGSYWESFAWSASTGFKSQEQRVTLTEAGKYWLEAVSVNGCIARDTFELRTAADLLHANFLLSSTASAGDTVVMIDVSWPLPERIAWRLPAEMNRLTDFGDIVYGTFVDTGAYEVALTAMLGECRDEMIKKIIILPGEDKADSKGSPGHEPFVTAFSLYPNPNDGSFDVSIAFREESRMMLTVWSMLSMQKIAQAEDRGKRVYHKHFDLPPLSSGNYTLRLDHDEGTRYLRFVVQ